MKILAQVALAGAVLVVPVSHADNVTQDCILEGNVGASHTDRGNHHMRVTFRSAEHGEQAPCRMARGNESRRIQFRAGDDQRLQDAERGSRVRYRYIEREGAADEWRLIDVEAPSR